MPAHGHNGQAQGLCTLGVGAAKVGRKKSAYGLAVGMADLGAGGLMDLHHPSTPNWLRSDGPGT